MDLKWRKSSFSEDSDGNCLELASQGDDVLIRESEVPQAIARVAPATLKTLLAYVRHMPIHSS